MSCSPLKMSLWAAGGLYDLVDRLQIWLTHLRWKGSMVLAFVGEVRLHGLATLVSSRRAARVSMGGQQNRQSNRFFALSASELSVGRGCLVMDAGCRHPPHLEASLPVVPGDSILGPSLYPLLNIMGSECFWEQDAEIHPGACSGSMRSFLSSMQTAVSYSCQAGYPQPEAQALAF